MIEQIEWLVGYRDRSGELRTTGEGAQSIFSLFRAQKLAKTKGDPWHAVHMTTKLAPDDHAAYIQDPEKACPNCLKSGLYSDITEVKGNPQCRRCFWIRPITKPQLRSVWGSNWAT